MSTSKKEERIIIPKITRSPDFRVIYTTGVFGALTESEGRMIFYVDRVLPRMKKSPPGAMETGEVERELQIEIHMSPVQWLSITEWMQGYVQKLEKEGRLKILRKKLIEG